jgi:hypothetical protein
MDTVVCSDDFLGTIVFLSGGTLFTIAESVPARITLRADAYSVSDLDIDDLGTDPNCFAYDLVAHAAGVCGWALFNVSFLFLSFFPCLSICEKA